MALCCRYVASPAVQNWANKVATKFMHNQLYFFQLLALPFVSKNWVVHLSKPTINHKQNIAYLGRYLKRPPLSGANILNSDGKFVLLCHLDRNTISYTTINLPVFEFIARFFSHIPDQYFKSIRYYGWLANRVRSQKLSVVYQKLQNVVSQEQLQKKLAWTTMLTKEFQFNPFECDNCCGYFALMGAFLFHY